MPGSQWTQSWKRELRPAEQGLKKPSRVCNVGSFTLAPIGQAFKMTGMIHKKTTTLKIPIGCVLLLGSLLHSSVAAPPADPVDDYVRGEMQRHHIPGLSLAVMKDGKMIKAEGYGFSNVELHTPATPQTVYQSASIGKQFTAAGVMLLVQQNKIGLDDKISRYLSDTPDSWKEITVKELLNHTSGIHNYDAKVLNYRQDYTEEQMLKCFESLPLDFAPGTKWAYDDTGYVLLGMIIRKVSGEFWGDFLQEQIFRPLGMDTTQVISEENIVTNRAAGYMWRKGALKNQDWVSPCLNGMGDGSLYQTVFDFAKWDAALYTTNLLNESSFRQMWTPTTLKDGSVKNYGFGWCIGTENGHRCVFHSGGWQGFKSFFIRYPDDKLSVVVLANLDKANVPAIAREVARHYEPALAVKN
jgi:CubicO group peptidase (beta-lactamase class C family)